MKKSQNGFSVLEGLLIFVIAGIVGFVGWYVWNSKNNANSSYSSAASVAGSASKISGSTSNPASPAKAAPTSSTTSTTNSTTKTTKNSIPPTSSSGGTTQSGISLTINPNHGPVGTSVSFQISGIQDTSNLKLAFTDSTTFNYDYPGLLIKPSDVQNGKYAGTYTIPASVVNGLSGCPGYCYTSTAKGQGKLILTHGQSSSVYTSASFTVE